MSAGAVIGVLGLVAAGIALTNKRDKAPPTPGTGQSVDVVTAGGSPATVTNDGVGPVVTEGTSPAPGSSPSVTTAPTLGPTGDVPSSPGSCAPGCSPNAGGGCSCSPTAPMGTELAPTTDGTGGKVPTLTTAGKQLYQSMGAGLVGADSITISRTLETIGAQTGAIW